MTTVHNISGLEAAQQIWGPETSTETIPIWLDCDTGHDDSFAILLCATCPRIKLLGISTVHGNASLEHTTNNTLSILEAIGHREVPVYPGAAKPFCREAAHAEAIHGVTGLDGTTVLPAPVASAVNHPLGTITAMYEALTAYPGTATLVATGSLTNVGLLFAAHPDLVSKLAHLSIMGGAVGGFFTNAPMGKVTEHLKLKTNVYEHFPAGLPDFGGLSIGEVTQKFKELGIIDAQDSAQDEKDHLLLDQARTSFGNWSPYAEFNIYCDPEAASSLFSDPVLAAKTTLIPLDLTHQVLATSTVLDLLKYGTTNPSSTTAVSTPRLLFHEIVTFFASTYASEFGMTDGPPLHDPLAVAAILAPAIFNDCNGERFQVMVVKTGEEDVTAGQKRRKGGKVGQSGRTIVKLLDKGYQGIRIPRGVNANVFWHLLNLALEKVDIAS